VPEAAPGLSIVPLVVAQRFQVDGYPLADGQPDNFTQLRPLDVAESSLAQWQFYALRAQYTARFGDFIASTGYFQRHSRDVEDGTMWFAFFQKEYYSPLPYLAASVLQSYDSRELTQEIRFQSHLQVPVQFVAGFFYQRATTTDPFSYPIPGLDAATGHALGSDNIYQENGRTVAQQTAGFVDITYTPVDRMEVSAGVRKAWLDYSGHQTIEQPPALDANISYSFDRRQHPFTPRFLVKYSFDQNDMAYASASKGFRIGGENAPATGPCAEGARELGVPVGVALPYDSDSLWSYEFGLKNLWDDARIATRAAAYYIEWKNIQQTVLLPVCGIGIQLNSGAAGILGTEAELTARIRTGFEIGAGFAYEDGKITAARTLPSGQTLGFRVDTPLSGVPKWTASLRASYSANTLIGEAFVRTEYNFAGSSLSLANGGAGLFRSEYSLVDLHGGLHFDNSTAGLFVTNLFNKPANYGDLVTAAGTVPGRPRLVVAQPRTLGLEARHSFGAQ
jgi:outer membrane receptor protein involved in Fe transport